MGESGDRVFCPRDVTRRASFRSAGVGMNVASKLRKAPSNALSSAVLETEKSGSALVSASGDTGEFGVAVDTHGAELVRGRKRTRKRTGSVDDGKINRKDILKEQVECASVFAIADGSVTPIGEECEGSSMPVEGSSGKGKRRRKDVKGKRRRKALVSGGNVSVKASKMCTSISGIGSDVPEAVVRPKMKSRARNREPIHKKAFLQLASGFCERIQFRGVESLNAPSQRRLLKRKAASERVVGDESKYIRKNKFLSVWFS
jgi:hypothetical protein